MVAQVADKVGVRAGCDALGVAAATFYRQRAPLHGQNVPCGVACAAGAVQEEVAFAAGCNSIGGCRERPHFLLPRPNSVAGTCTRDGVSRGDDGERSWLGLMRVDAVEGVLRCIACVLILATATRE